MNLSQTLLGQRHNALPDFSEHLKSALKMSNIPLDALLLPCEHYNFPLREVEGMKSVLFFIHIKLSIYKHLLCT